MTQEHNQVREQMLAQMGIKPLWVLRQRSTEADATPEVAHDTALAVQAPVQSQPQVEIQTQTQSSVQIPPPEPVVAEAVPVVQVKAAEAIVTRDMGWDDLAQSVKSCQACGLCEQRKQAVLGVGNKNASWMFIGEGPGAEEDEKGEPFVGQAGKLLDAMLGSIGLQRARDVYIANAVKCRPPNNRTPESGEISTCRPYLERQIALVKPKLIIALGRPAVQTLLGGEPKISALRGKLFHYETPVEQGEQSPKIPVVVTYHPAYLLRNLVDKSKAWEDLCFAQDQMQSLSE